MRIDLELRAAATLLLLLLAGCSDDPTGPGRETTLLGDWQVVETEFPPVSKAQLGSFARAIRFGRSYVSIDEDRIWVLNEAGIGVRREFLTHYVLGDQLELAKETFAIRFERGFVLLDGPTVTARLERRQSIPDPERWIDTYQAFEPQNTTNQCSGDLAFDGEDLWVSGGPDGFEMFRRQSGSGTSFLVEDLPIRPNAIEFHDAELFLNDGNEAPLYRLRIRESGVTVSSPGPEIGRRITALISDDSLLWCVSNQTRRLHLYDFDRGAEVGALEFGGGFTLDGGTYHDGTLYLASKGTLTLFAVDRDDDGIPTALRSTGAIELPGHEILGVAHDGTRLWVNARDESNDAMRLTRIVPAEQAI